MAIKMKGLLKGLRYISTIFDEEEKEKEMQIGLPTDVKHVAHIGYDGPAANNPSWIDNFNGGEPIGGGASTNGDQLTEAKLRNLTGFEQPLVESLSRRRSEKSKGSRRSSSASAGDSPKRLSTSNSARDKTEGGDKNSSKSSLRKKKTKSGSSSGQSSSRGSTKSKATSLPSDTPHNSDLG